MKTRGTFLVKEIVKHIQGTLQLAGTFCTSNPVKEVHEIKYFVSPITTVLGKKGIAYFGKVELQLYYIDCKDQTLHLTEQQLPFRGFSICEVRCQNKDLKIDIEGKITDTFVEDICNETMKVFVILQIDLLLTMEKELETAQLLNPQGDRQYSVETIEADPSLIIQNVTIE